MKKFPVWGTLLILVGASILLKNLFNIDLPIFEIIVPLLLIFAGISIVMNQDKKE